MFIFYFFMPEFLDITYKKYGYGNNIVFFFLFVLDMSHGISDTVFATCVTCPVGYVSDTNVASL